ARRDRPVEERTVLREVRGCAIVAFVELRDDRILLNTSEAVSELDVVLVAGLADRDLAEPGLTLVVAGPQVVDVLADQVDWEPRPRRLDGHVHDRIGVLEVAHEAAALGRTRADDH